MNIYLSKQERELLTKAAQELGTTQAYVVRLVLRSMFDLPLPPSAEDELRHIYMGHVHIWTRVRG